MVKSSKKKSKEAKLDAEGRLVVATNRRATFEYEILDRFEAGIVLTGPEVKSLRAAQANLGDAFASIHRGEAWLEKLHISPYEPATRDNPADPQRRRKLLLHRREIERLEGKVAEKGLTLVPLRIYFLRGRAKVEIALARGKQRHDKRETIKRRELDREARRAMRRHTR
ncbi:MAG: SsrA-binding protein SmpB [Deltaproteobacteria bacterium]|jgi:SsrA-binding protein|nr:SsrA-binding protein SmpB [Deltaproteobacteria bacterium]